MFTSIIYGNLDRGNKYKSKERKKKMEENKQMKLRIFLQSISKYFCFGMKKKLEKGKQMLLYFLTIKILFKPKTTHF